jgi:hypothetical protein
VRAQPRTALTARRHSSCYHDQRLAILESVNPVTLLGVLFETLNLNTENPGGGGRAVGAGGPSVDHWIDMGMKLYVLLLMHVLERPAGG